MSQHEIPAICTDPEKRHDFVLLFDVTLGNPNGDPDAGNLPRVDPETMHGVVTDVALKRKIRNYAQLAGGKGIFVQSQVALNTLIARGFRDSGARLPQVPVPLELVEWFEKNPREVFDLQEDGTVIYTGESATPKPREILDALLEGVDDPDERSEVEKPLRQIADALAAEAKRNRISPDDRAKAQRRLLDDYYDIRMFGAVLGTGLNAGQVRGPMQLTFARSVDPVFQHNLTITRQARTTKARMATGSTEMGRKPIVPYGLYRAHGFFSPHLAKTTGVTSADLEVFWRALAGGMWDFDRSAARPEMATRGLFVFSHASPLGNAPAHRLFERIRVFRRPEVAAPRSFQDYETKVEDAELPASVALTRLES